MLPGMFIGPGMAAGAGGGLTLTYVASSTDTAAATMVMPTLSVGDIIIAAVAASVGVPPLYGTGFTSLGTLYGAISGGADPWYMRFCVSYKIAVSGDSGSSIGGFLSGHGALMVYSPSDPINTVTQSGITSTYTSANPASTSVPVSGASGASIAVGALGGGSGGSYSNSYFTTFSSAPDATADINGVTLACLAQGVGGSDVTMDPADAGYNFVKLFYLDIT